MPTTNFEMNNKRSITAAILLTIGMLGGAWILGQHWVEARTAQRYVTVKGLSERIVRADHASWSLIGTYSVQSTDEAQRQIRAHEQAVRSFLMDRGFTDDEIKTNSINIFRNNYERAAEPYNVEVQVTVETDDVDAVEAASYQISELIANGVLLSGNKWQTGPRYFFTEFQSIKTEMLAEATQNARASAEEFALNSGSEVGKIKYANQGVFQVLPASRNNEEAEFHADKLIRVVTTVDYVLR
ncbi:MAG: SIMPL domain-containing protein [Saprospiraceae bacterium]|nr:SIMPL domain-containing protein [Saprospiraceae bacterium]